MNQFHPRRSHQHRCAAPLETAKNPAIYGITFGNNQFVAVGRQGLVLTSPDGISWSRRDCGIDDYFSDLTSVTYGNGLFVAVTAYLGGVTDHPGNILTSPDGINWTQQTFVTGYGNYLYGVAFANGLFVAVGGDFNAKSIVLTSADGATWTQRFSGISPAGNLYGVTYGSGLFVAVGLYQKNSQYLGTIFTSSDGINWTRRYDWQTGKYLRAVAYANGQFAAVGDYDSLLTSLDGVSWTARNAGSGNSFSGVAIGNGQFVAVGSSSGIGTILTAQDGSSWTKRNSGRLNDLYGVGYANGLFLATGFGTNLVSSDGIAWSGGNSPVTGRATFAFGGGQFVAATEYLDAEYGWYGSGLFTSADWLTWTQRNSTSFGIAYGNGQFVALNDTYNSKYLTSSDGVAWVSHSFPSPWGGPIGITYGGGKFVVFASGCCLANSGWVFVSQDGTNWNNYSLTVTNGYFPSTVVYGNGRFVAVGQGTIVTSSDGISWQEMDAATGLALSDVCYAAGQFVAVGSDILTSPDGLTWTKRNIYALLRLAQ